MLRVGLTGGIASGKSTVAAWMRELGCYVLDADKLAHQLTEPGQPPYEEVVREFGSEILLPDRRINRDRLAAIVFADRSKLAKLNVIVHPRVIAEQDRELARIAYSQSDAVAVVEAALLIEAGYHSRLDRLVVVWCRPEQQLERLLARGLTREEADLRIAAQMPLEQKRALADDLIDCSGPLERTRLQVEELVAKLKSLATSRGRSKDA